MVTGLAVHSTHTVYVVVYNGAGLMASDAPGVTGTTLSNPAVSTAATVTPASPNGSNGWYTSSPSIALSSRPIGLSANTYCWWDAASPAAYSTPLSMPSDGSHDLHYYSVDQADPANREATATLSFKLDSVAPSPPTTVNAVTVSTTSIALDWTAGADAVSGVDHYRLYVDNVLQPQSYTTTSATITNLTPNTIYTFNVVAVDAAGNESAQSPGVIGTTAASTALSTVAQSVPATANGLHGWYTTTPQITLLSNPASITADTYYWWDTSAPATYTAPVSPSSDGTHTLSFWSVDQAHQHAQEDTQQVTYHVDTTNPSLPGNVTASGDTTTSLSIAWLPSADAQSGIDHYEVWVGGIDRGPTTNTSARVTALQVNTTYLVHIVAVNGAGLTAATEDINGTTASNPAISTVSTVTPSSPNGENGWYKTTPTVTLSTEPPTVPAWTYYSWGVSAVATYTGPMPVPSDGLHSLHFRSVDKADSTNRDTTQTIDFQLDSVAPGPPTTVNAVTVNTTSLDVSWTAGSDLTSGVDHYKLYMDGVQWGGDVVATGTPVTGLLPNSIHTFTVVAVDAAGNASIESPSAMGVTAALAPLVTTATLVPSSPDGLDGWYVTTPTVSFSVEPTVSAWTYYGWNGSAMSTATGPVQPQSNGNVTLSYWSVDQAHQHSQEATNSLTLKMDTLEDVRNNPDATASILATQTLVTDSEIDLAWTPAIDPYSGLNHYEVWDEYVGSTTDLSYIVDNLKPLTWYSYKIYAVNNAGVYFSQSETITVETSAPPLPYTPSAVAAVSPSGGFANVDWSVSSIAVGDLGYHVWRSEDASTFSQVATITGQYSTTYTDEGLKSSTRYWYAVSAFDDRGESPLSEVSTATEPYIAPVTGRAERVTGLSSIEGSHTVLLSWNPDTNAAVDGYLVTRATKSLGVETTLTPVEVVATGTPTYIDNTAVNGQTYYYTVYPVDASSTVGFPSLEVEAKPHSVLGTDTVNPHVVKVEGDAVVSAQCATCHFAHGQSNSGSVYQMTGGGSNEVPTCLMCHSKNSGMASTDTSSSITDPLNESSIAMWTPSTPGATMTCTSCHRALSNEASGTAGLLASGGTVMSWWDGDVEGNQVCYNCHGASSTLKYGDMTDFEDSAHANVPDPASGSQVKCVDCHEDHASHNTRMTRYEGYMVCVQCHSSASSSADTSTVTPSDPNQPSIWDSLTLNSDANAKHPLLPEDHTSGAKMSCQNCHSTHSSTLENPLVNPRNLGPSGIWTGYLATDTKSYCFECHDGNALPTSAETTPYADAVLGQSGATTLTDIKSAYDVNVHGSGVATDSTTTNDYLRTDMGYSAGDSLDCTACHDTHGSSNNFALRQSVVSASRDTTISGVLVYKIPAGSITPTSPVGYDLRFFCSTCHKFDPETHDPLAGTDTTQFGKTDCTTCHSHVDAGGSPSTGL